MSKRPVEFTEIYVPGKKYGGTRTVTIDRIPGSEVTSDGVTDTIMTSEVGERIDVLIERALRANALQHQRITFTASDDGITEGRRSPARSAARVEQR